MAIINSIGVGKAKGSMGNVTYKTRKGLTIGSQKVSKGQQKVGTYRQVTRRVMLANLVTAYQRLNAIGDGNGMHHAFPLRERGNDFNGFVAKNMSKPSVAAVMLPKDLGSVLVPAPFIVSRGNLQAPTDFQSTFNDGKYTMAGTHNFTNMGDLAEAMIADYGFQQGDIVTIFTMTWGTTAMQSAIIRGYQFVIDTNSTASLPTYISSAGVFDVAPATNSDAVIIRGRNDNGWDVSDAEFSDAAMNSAAYIAYTGAAAELTAVDSWGYRSNPYLQNGNF